MRKQDNPVIPLKSSPLLNNNPDSMPGALSRNEFLKVSGATSLGLLLASCGLKPTQTITPAPEEIYLTTRDKVPDPKDVFFTVEYPGKSPIKLAGHYWYNTDVEKSGEKVPAIVEFNPYRRRDGMMIPDSMMYPWFAYNQYLCFRVDLQGSGDSEGFLADEYTDEELSYCIQVIQQIADRPDCDGNVGMMGKSWSAINSLMVAARSDCPEALKAVIVCCGTDDRYNDDVHYMGGAMMFDNVSWASSMLAWLALPPDPLIVGDRWQEMWRERIKGANFMFKEWGARQTRDDYWAASAVRDRWDRVRVPVFILSGWEDGYKNPVERVATGLAAARKPVSGLIGPWGHKYPFDGYPGPRIDWLHYTVTNWWDKWLKGKTPPSGSEWPQMTVWLGESREPNKSACEDDKGKWIAEDGDWRKRNRPELFFPGVENRLYRAAPQTRFDLDSPERLVLDTGMFETSSWGECGNDDLPGNQAVPDSASMVFDSEPLSRDLDCFGYPEATLNLTCDKPLAAIAVRVCEIHPKTNSSHLVSYRFHNLCYRGNDDEGPKPIEPGTLFQTKVTLNLVGHTFKKNWRVRLSISPSFFPTMWQSPEKVKLTFHTGPVSGLGESVLSLPVRLPRPEDAKIQSLLPKTSETIYVDPGDYLPVLNEGRPARTERTASPVTLDGKDGMLVHKVFDSGRYQYGGLLEGLWVDQAGEEFYQMSHDDPLSLTGRSKYTTIYERPSGNWKVRSETTSNVWSEKASPGDPSMAEFVFRYQATIETFITDEQGIEMSFESKKLEGSIPRIWV
jgi:predicted acyl esterase